MGYEIDATQYLIRFRNLYSGPALLLGLENAQKYPKELAGFRRLIYTEGHHEFYRSQWPRAPALPFLLVHSYAKNWETKTHDFFLFVLYSEWRRQGNEDDLNGYTASDSAWTGASSESDQKASKGSGAWCNSLAFLNSLVSLLCRFLSLRSFVVHRSALLNRLSIHRIAQKVLELRVSDEELGIRSQDKVLQDSMTAMVAPPVVHVHKFSKEG